MSVSFHQLMGMTVLILHEKGVISAIHMLTGMHETNQHLLLPHYRPICNTRGDHLNYLKAHDESSPCVLCIILFVLIFVWDSWVEQPKMLC